MAGEDDKASVDDNRVVADADRAVQMPSSVPTWSLTVPLTPALSQLLLLYSSLVLLPLALLPRPMPSSSSSAPYTFS